ncbi:Protein DHC-4 [Aphelenchoides avenae]|nr:Protein DHC-4 [Aphelenchus avenae]
MRVLIDGELEEKIRESFFAGFDRVLIEECQSSLEKLFPSKASAAEDDDDEDEFYTRNVGSSFVIPDFSLKKLLFSELSGLETMEGIPYGIVVSRTEFNRTLENLHFEYSRNHEDYRINLVVTDYISDHCQRIMRACRQHSSHIALAGRPGFGRQQCAKLAAFGIIGNLYHVYFDYDSATAFEGSWKRVMRRVIQTVSSTNQPVAVVFHLDYMTGSVPPEWLAMLKSWLQWPVIGDLLTDDNVLRAGEKMVESEKMLATLVQSSNIRLPGQRYCQFLSFEALKDVALLRNVYSARITDFLHGIFLVPPESLRFFEWCNMDYFWPLTASERKQMIEKTMSECKYESHSKVVEALNQLFASAMGVISKIITPLNDLFPETKLLFDLAQSVVAIYNEKYSRMSDRLQTVKNALSSAARIRELSMIESSDTYEELSTRIDDYDLTILFVKRHHQENVAKLEQIRETIDLLQQEVPELSEKLHKQNAKIDVVLETPDKEFREIGAKLGTFQPSDYKKVAGIPTPSVGLRYIIESVRLLIEPDFKPGKNAAETWAASQRAFTDRRFPEKLRTFSPHNVDSKKLTTLKRYTDNREFKGTKVESESKLASVLCQWVLSAANIANANKTLRVQRKSRNDLSSKLADKEASLTSLLQEKEECSKLRRAFESDLEYLEKKLMKTKRIMDYRFRSEKILAGIGKHQGRWQGIISATKATLANILGNCLFEAGFRTILLSQTPDVKVVCAAL